MKFRRQILVLTAATAFQMGAGARADIIVTDWELTTAASDNYDPSSFDIVRHETVTFPFHEIHHAISGPTSAESNLDFTLEGNSATFHFDFGLARSASESRAVTCGRIRFVTTEPLAYEIAGGLVMSGTGTLVLHAHLVEAAYPNPHLYLGDHVGREPNESFTLGMPGGGLGWTEAGNLSGTVMPYVGYELYYQYDLQHYPITDTVATAQGDLSFVLMPEPSALIIGALGGLVLIRRRR